MTGRSSFLAFWVNRTQVAGYGWKQLRQTVMGTYALRLMAVEKNQRIGFPGKFIMGTFHLEFMSAINAIRQHVFARIIYF